MKAFVQLIRAFLTTLFSPFITILSGLHRLLGTFIKAIITLPTEVVASAVDHAENKTKGLKDALNTKTASKTKATKNNEVRQVVASLLENRMTLQARRNSRVMKTLLIVLLQMVSFATTYRGLAQCVETLGPYAPLLLTCVIQIGLTFLCSTISAATNKGTWVVLIVLLGASLSMSYLGVAETLIDYTKYAGTVYTDFQTEYTGIMDIARQEADGYQNAAANVEGQYALITSILASAEQKYGTAALADAEAEVSDFGSRTTKIIIPLGTYTQVFPEGTTEVVGGGSKVESVPDPAYAEPLLQAKAVVADIKAHQSLVSDVKALVDSTLALENVTRVISDQGDKFSFEFTAMAASAPALVNAVNKLSEDLGSNTKVSLDLTQIAHSSRQAVAINALRAIPDFNVLRDTWRGDTQSDAPDVGSDWANALLSTFTAATPSKLKELLDSQVNSAYKSLTMALGMSQGNDDLIAGLEGAYQAYELQNPLTFAFDALSPESPFFKLALLAMCIALLNDGCAVLIGILFEGQRLRYTSMEALTPGALRLHFNESIEDIITPLIVQRFRGTKAPPSMLDIATAFGDIIIEFTGGFQLFDSPALDEDFACIIGKSSLIKEFHPIYKLLLRCGLLKSIQANEAVSIGLISNLEVADGAGYFLMTSRCDALLAELLGSTAAYTLPDLVA